MSVEEVNAKRIAGSPAPVSVIVPCYRCKGTIRRAIESVARQTTVPAEVILIDDASGDGTLELLVDLRRELGETWVKLIALERNSGAASARNAGWDAASERYIALLDADDAWHPRKVEIQCAFLEAHPEVSVCGHAYRRLNEGERGDEHALDPPGFGTVSIGMLLLSNRFVTPSVMIRRDVPFRFLEGRRYMEDHLLWLEIASSGRRLAYLKQALAFTHKAATGASGLSARTWEMRKAELANLWRLRRLGRINLVAAVALSGYSLAKHCARAALMAAGRGQ
jgi:glycosyltransferase involved in cell wall biosynthesis